jgi:hypothetical protein
VPQLASLDRRACRERVEREFTVERMIDRYLDAYRLALAQKLPPPPTDEQLRWREHDWWDRPMAYTTSRRNRRPFDRLRVTDKNERDYSHRTLIQKLGIKPEHRVCLRVSDQAVVKLVASSVDTVPGRAARGRYDIMLFEVNTRKDLDAIASLAAHLESNGALWIVHPKGKGASPHEAEVRAAGLAAGLVDNKICAYSSTHTATRFVIPVARRGMLQASKSRR